MKKTNLKTCPKSSTLAFGAIAFAAISGMLFSCAKEELDYNKLNLIGDPKPITVNATLPKSANLEKTLVDSDGKVCWEPNDTIVVNGSTLQITSILPSGTEAVFTGTAGEMIGTNGYWATYPFAPQQSDYTNNSVAVTLPATQTYSSGDRLQNYMVAYAVSEDPGNISFAFKNLCCMLKFQVKSQNNDNQSTNKLSKIEVVSNQSIAGTAMVQMDGSGNPAFTSWTNGGKILTLNCGNTQLNNGEGVIFSVMLPAGTQSLSVKFYDATGKYMRKTVSGASLARSCMYNLSATLNATEDPSHLSGLFSVSSTKKVYFSPGNLQWTSTGTHAVAGGDTAAGTWRFASNQWDYIGNAAGNNTADASRETQAAWIDLFGWGTSGYDNTAKDPDAINFQPWASSTSTVNTTYNYYGYGPSLNRTDRDLVGTSANYDWGVYNVIYNPKTNTPDAAGTWRTMTCKEWQYLLGTSGTSCRGVDNKDWWIYDVVTIKEVDGTNDLLGLIIYPDGVTAKPDGITATLTGESQAAINITTSDFAILESLGCVFLPAAGFRLGSSVNDVGTYGCYWSATYYNSHNAYNMGFYSGSVGPSYSGSRCNGRSVRLVQDAN